MTERDQIAEMANLIDPDVADHLVACCCTYCLKAQAQAKRLWDAGYRKPVDVEKLTVHNPVTGNDYPVTPRATRSKS